MSLGCTPTFNALSFVLSLAFSACCRSVGLLSPTTSYLDVGAPFAWLAESSGPVTLRGPTAGQSPGPGALSSGALEKRGMRTSTALPLTRSSRWVKNSGSEFRGQCSATFASRCFKLLEFDVILSRWVVSGRPACSELSTFG